MKILKALNVWAIQKTTFKNKIQEKTIGIYKQGVQFS